MIFAALSLLMAQGQGIVSPEVHTDHTVTFRYKDPAATAVTVGLEGGKPVAMTKGAGGIWSVTTPALTPDIYGYTFSVDGETRLDPHNPDFKPNLIWQSNMVTVPGGQPWEERNVPHGSLHRHFFHSSIVGDDRDFVVYTPPGYASSRSKYPVLYLLHGFSDTSDGWTAVGKAHVIMDNLIADGKAKPMVVVMPLGYGVANFHRDRPAVRNQMDWGHNIEFFGKSLLGEVQPQVEQMYRVSMKPQDRAIAGLSMGGAETLTVGLNNLDRYTYIGAFSSGGLNNQFDQVFPHLTGDEASKRLKLLFISCGTEDGLITPNRQVVAWLKGKNVNLTARETPGAHTWMVWRRNLIEFAGQLFR